MTKFALFNHEIMMHNAILGYMYFRRKKIKKQTLSTTATYELQSSNTMSTL